MFPLLVVVVCAARLYTAKQRVAQVDRVVDDHTVILRNLIGKETDPTPFIGLRGWTAAGLGPCFKNNCIFCISFYQPLIN